VYVINPTKGRITQFALPDCIYIVLGNKSSRIAFTRLVAAWEASILLLLVSGSNPTILRTVALVVVSSIHLESG